MATKAHKISRFSRALAIHMVDFPIYYVECISERHFVVAGGGGSSKTGVHNQINILELVATEDSCAAQMTMKYKTPEEIPDAIMSGSLVKGLPIISQQLVTGASQLIIYNIIFDSLTKSFKVVDHQILSDDRVRSELKCVKTMAGKILFGGMEGQLGMWDIAESPHRLVRQIQAHKGKEIDEIDVDLNQKQVVTLSRGEARCAIWDLSTFKPLQEFRGDFINQPAQSASAGKNVKFVYRSCRFACDSSSKSGQDNKSHLLVVCNLIGTNSGSSKLLKWSTENYKNCSSATFHSDGVMTMTVSSDAKLVAFGSRGGSVTIFEVKNLKQIYKLDKAHQNAVTNLSFLPAKAESLSLTNSTVCPLLSVSIDRRIVIHRPRKSHITSLILKLLILVAIIYSIFFVIFANY